MKKFLLLLSFFINPLTLFAQGVRHVNIAQGSVTLAGSSGFSGAVARILSGATVTVCNGNTLPASGSPCTGLANIFSDIALTQALANPTTADTNGNYSFYAAGGVPYVISVSFVGFTTYSYVWSAPLSGTGNAATFSSINKTQVVDGTTNATILAAYNNLQASGGQVYIPAGSYTVALGTLSISKPVRFVCEDPKTTIITFTGASGVAFLVNYDDNPPTGSYLDWGNGIENCQIIGPGTINGGAGNAGTAIQLGDATHGSIGAVFKSDIIAGFTLGTTWANGNSWGTKFDHVTWLNNTQEVLWNVSSGTGLADIEFDHPNFNHFQVGVTMQANAVQFTGTINGEFKMTAPYFQSDQFACNSSYIEMMAPTFENTNGATTSYWLTNTGGCQLTMYAPSFLNDNTSATVPTAFINNSGSNGYIGTFDARFFNASATTFPAINLGGSANTITVGLRPVSNISAIFTGSSTGYTFGNDPTTGVPLFNGNKVVAVNVANGPGPINGGGFFANQGTPCTNGELALSAGWQSTGSATVTAVSGSGQTCSWTITTGTTTAANPTVTDTLTNALPAATTVCEMNIHGGTHTAAAGEGFQQTTLSATAPVFTFNGTPTAGGTTYFVTRRCGP